MRDDFRVQLVGLIGLLLLLLSPGCSGRGGITHLLLPTERGGGAKNVSVSDVQLGLAMDREQRVSKPATIFGPRDPVFASVIAAGAGREAELEVRCLDQDGNVIHEKAQMISPNGHRTFGFQVDPSRPGRYRVDVLVDGVIEASEEFEVKAV